MAPTSNSATSLQQNRVRPAAARRVVPAIPLPYIQKRKQQDAALAKAQEEAAIPTPAEAAEAVEAPSSPTPPASETATPVINGPAEHESEITESSVEPSPPQTPATPATPALEEGGETVETEVAVGAEGNSIYEETAEDSQYTPHSIPSESQSSVSRSTYHMPPPFIPANQQQFNGVHHEPAPGPPQNLFNGQLSMHHGHPSNGGSMIHGYPPSNSSSPAPPLSAGHMSPYPYPYPEPPPPHPAARHTPQLSNGIHPHQVPNGYAPMGPPPHLAQHPRPNGFSNPGADTFARRQMASNRASEGYSPSGTPVGFDARENGYPPSTPRSVHGSQSSGPHDHDGGQAFYGQYPTAVISNGSNGQIDDVRLYQPSRPNRDGPPLPISYPPFPDSYDGLVGYIQLSFANPMYADYAIEVRHLEDRVPPISMPGHGIVLAQSPTLKLLMDTALRGTPIPGSTTRTLVVETADRFITSDGFWLAMQRLYGNILLDASFFNRPEPPPFFPKTKLDQVDFALGYAASGRVLQIRSVLCRGVDIAIALVDLNTVERVLDFALEGGLISTWCTQPADQQDREPSSPTYGPAVNGLIHRCVTFLVAAFPARLILDTSVGEASHNSCRLPIIPYERPPPHGHNPRLSQIKFGEYSTDERYEISGTTCFSRVLINLPFPLLKTVMESPMPPQVENWANPSVRQETMWTIVNEREKRRLRVHASDVPDADRLAHPRKWEAVGWQESVRMLNGNLGPCITRTWVGFTKEPAPSL